MGKSFPHPVGVFCTIPNPPKSRIIKKIDFWPYLVIFRIIPTTVGNILPINRPGGCILYIYIYNFGSLLNAFGLSLVVLWRPSCSLWLP